MSVRILRVIGVRSTSPGVLAIVDGNRVRWDGRRWSCACPDPACQHVDAVADLLDPRVTGGSRERTPARTP